jgi:hypothetical protein
VANFTKGWLGMFYDRMGPAAFWLLHSAVAATGLVLILFFGLRLARAF